MSQKVFTINSSTAQYNDDELQFLDSLVHTEGVFGDPDTGVMGLQVSERGAPDMNVEVAIGNAFIEVVISGRTLKAVLKNTATETIAIAANVSGTDRVDAIIARIDVDTEPDILKTNIGTIERVNGTSATALTDGAITTAVGSDGWIRLADVTVIDSETAIENADITDTRVKVSTTAAVKIEDASNPSLTEDDTTAGAVLESQTASTSSISFGEVDTTGNNNKASQTFKASKTKIKSVSLYKKPDTGTFVGDVTIALQADVSGSPSGSALATVTISNADWLLLADNAEFEALFTSEYDGLIVGGTYWIIATSSTADALNNPTLGGATGDPYADGGAYFENTTDGWTALAATDLYFKTFEGIENQVVKTDANGKVSGVLSGKVTVYTADNTWVKPEGLSYVIVEVIGGGGGGGGNTASSTTSGGGGGGGYSRKLILADNLAINEDITIGLGGVGTYNAETDGGATLFGVHLQATGGTAGATDSQVTGLGGVGTLGDINLYGETPPRPAADGNHGGSGKGGDTQMGIGGAPDYSTSSGSGNVGTGYGSGGGGAFSNSADVAGGSGKDGVVIITEF